MSCTPHLTWSSFPFTCHDVACYRAPPSISQSYVSLNSAHSLSFRARQRLQQSHPLHHRQQSAQVHSTPHAEATPFHARQVQRVVANLSRGEGRGVTVRRSIGLIPRYFNPFAVLDHFVIDEGSLAKGVGFHPHPHRGIATLTYLFPTECNGTVVHQDHLGHHGVIGPGDVQFMSAGKGIVHSEMPGSSCAVEGLQLWLNLSQANKLSPPRYQDYLADDIPTHHGHGVTAKVVAGTAFGLTSALQTPSPIQYIDLRLAPFTSTRHVVPPHYNALLYAFGGDGEILSSPTSPNDANEDNHVVTALPSFHTVFFGLPNHREGEAHPDTDFTPSSGLHIRSGKDGLRCVIIAGEPHTDGAPVVQYGPIIMNSQQEINDAFEDYQHGRNGFEGALAFEQAWKPPSPSSPNH